MFYSLKLFHSYVLDSRLTHLPTQVVRSVRKENLTIHSRDFPLHRPKFNSLPCTIYSHEKCTEVHLLGTYRLTHILVMQWTNAALLKLSTPESDLKFLILETLNSNTTSW